MTKLMLLVQGILLSIILGILMHHWRIWTASLISTLRAQIWSVNVLFC
jgi:hypothetical protein